MLKNYYYAHEKLAGAEYSLAVGPGDVRSRLGSAYLSHLHTLRESDFPEEEREEWRSLMREMTKHGPWIGYDGKVRVRSVSNTMRIIRNKTGAKLASRIVSLKYRIEGYLNK